MHLCVRSCRSCTHTSVVDHPGLEHASYRHTRILVRAHIVGTYMHTCLCSHNQADLLRGLHTCVFAHVDMYRNVHTCDPCTKTHHMRHNPKCLETCRKTPSHAHENTLYTYASPFVQVCRHRLLLARWGSTGPGSRHASSESQAGSLRWLALRRGATLPSSALPALPLSPGCHPPRRSPPSTLGVISAPGQRGGSGGGRFCANSLGRISLAWQLGAWCPEGSAACLGLYSKV